MPEPVENPSMTPIQAGSSGLLPPAAPAQRQTVFWIIALLLAVMVTLLATRRDDSAFLRSALAQSTNLPRGNLEGGRGIYAFTGQVSARSYGLFMLDVDTGTVWCYELQRVGQNNEPRLNLVAARSWVFDRYLEEFNTGDPIPSAVKALVQQQQRGTGATTPSPGGNGTVPPPAGSGGTSATRPAGGAGSK